jgi:hypothetical protein
MTVNSGTACHPRNHLERIHRAIPRSLTIYVRATRRRKNIHPR